MPCVVILHGWDDDSSTFGPLRAFLGANGFQIADIRLGDYISIDDDVRIQDVAKRMQTVFQERIAAGNLTVPFDLIVHSTGGLVAREWITRYYPDGTNCPVKRVVMLAPANFGSRLASLGKSMLGRIKAGWKNWFESGRCMLEALELASEYQWGLVQRDLLSPDGVGTGPYHDGGVWPFVITGSRGYSSMIRQIVNESGSDGTIRVPAANMNTAGVTLDFTGQQVAATGWTSRTGFDLLPFAVLPDRDHTTIHQVGEATCADPGVVGRLPTLILQALNCQDTQTYQAIAQEWQDLSEQTHHNGVDGAWLARTFPNDRPDPEDFHQYIQVVSRVRDDHGIDVPDYFLEFFAPGQVSSNREMIYFHREVLEHVHTNTLNAARRCLMIDRTDLMNGYYAAIPKPANKVLGLSISATPPGPNVHYFGKAGAQGSVLIHAEDAVVRGLLGTSRLVRNSTLFMDIIIPRNGLPKVFKLS